MSKRLPYPDFKNGYVDIELKMLRLTCKSILKLNEPRPCQSIKKISYECIENIYWES